MKIENKKITVKNITFSVVKNGAEIKGKNIKIYNKVSSCCKAPVKLGNSLPDFIGEKEPYKIGTQYYVCLKCGDPCDIIY